MVDAAQGQEAPIVIFMLTVTNQWISDMPFVANKRRLNLAMSRAQQVFIIVGDFMVFDNEVKAKLKEYNWEFSCKLVTGVAQLKHSSSITRWQLDYPGITRLDRG